MSKRRRADRTCARRRPAGCARPGARHRRYGSLGPRGGGARGTGPGSTTSEGDRGEAKEEFRSGSLVVARDPALRVLLCVQGFYQVLVGASDLLVAILALSILHIGQGGAGYLNAAIGVGAVLSGAITVGLIGRSKLAGVGCLRVLGATVILAVIGFNSTVILAFIFLAAVGLVRRPFRRHGAHLAATRCASRIARQRVLRPRVAHELWTGARRRDRPRRWS